MHAALDDRREVRDHEIARGFGRPHPDSRQRDPQHESVHEADGPVDDEDFLARLHSSRTSVISRYAPYHDFRRVGSQFRMSPRPYQLAQRAESTERNRRRILDAAYELIAEAGFHPVSLDAVAERAGVTRVTIYRHFGSKRGLLEAVNWHRLEQAQLT